MHCASCEVLIERKLKQVPGVERVYVNYTNGGAEILCSSNPDLRELESKIKADGYTLSWAADNKNSARKNGVEDYLEMIMIFLFIVSLYLVFSGLHLIPDLGITPGMSYGFVFLIGLVAATSSCIAVTGGLLLAVAAKYNEAHPNLTGTQKFKPHVFFNAGRIVSYTVLGGLVGSLGSALSLSIKATGFLTILASLVMILFGLQILKIFPGLSRFQPKMPKFIAHKIHEASMSQSKIAPFLLGGATFFLPCGFTQALQIYVLSRGSFAVGALTMLAFSLGTLPALLSLSAISSFAKGTFQRIFLRFSAVSIIILGVLNINRGLALTGTNFVFGFGGSGPSAQAIPDNNAQIVNGIQIVKMTASGYDYAPSHFTVQQGIPVEWQIDGTRAAGCAQVVVSSGLGITQYLKKNEATIVRFIPTQTGTFLFSCPMGMTTRGAAFTVVPNTSGVISAVNAISGEVQNAPDDANAQKFNMDITQERGFYPKSFTVKKGLPVAVSIDDRVKLGGCMSVLLIPQYNVAVHLNLGSNSLRFTPTESGTIYATCSMGSKILRFDITNT